MKSARKKLRLDLFQLSLVCGQIGALMQAGLPVPSALRTVAQQTDDPSLKYALPQVTAAVESGILLSEAMKAYPALFNDAFLSLIRAGEESGQLTQSFWGLANWLERDHRIVARTRGALIYPAFVIGVSSFLTMLLFTTFLPRLFVLFENSATTLPPLTRAVAAVVNLMLNPLCWLVAGVAVWEIRQWLLDQLRRPEGRLRLYRWLARVPIVGELLTWSSASRLCLTLATLLSSGINLSRAWVISAEASGNPLLGDDSRRVYLQLMGGLELSEILKGDSRYPYGMAGWLRGAEEAAALPEMLPRMANTYELEADSRVAMLSAAMEPLFLVGMGGLVVLVLLSIVLPLYQTISQVSP